MDASFSKFGKISRIHVEYLNKYAFSRDYDDENQYSFPAQL